VGAAVYLDDQRVLLVGVGIRRREHPPLYRLRSVALPGVTRLPARRERNLLRPADGVFVEEVGVDAGETADLAVVGDEQVAGVVPPAPDECDRRADVDTIDTGPVLADDPLGVAPVPGPQRGRTLVGCREVEPLLVGAPPRAGVVAERPVEIRRRTRDAVAPSVEHPQLGLSQCRLVGVGDRVCDTAVGCRREELPGSGGGVEGGRGVGPEVVTPYLVGQRVVRVGVADRLCVVEVVSAPRGAGEVRLAVGQSPDRVVAEVDHVDVWAAAVEVPLCRPVDGPVDDPRVRLLGFVVLGVDIVSRLALGGARALDERDALARRAPGNPGDPTRDGRHLPALAAAGRDDPQLRAVPVAAGGDERDAVAARAVPWLAVDPRSGGEPAGLAALCRDRVHCRLVLLAVGDPPDERNLVAVGGDPRLLDLDEFLEIRRGNPVHNSPCAGAYKYRPATVDAFLPTPRRRQVWNRGVGVPSPSISSPSRG